MSTKLNLFLGEVETTQADSATKAITESINKSLESFDEQLGIKITEQAIHATPNVDSNTANVSVQLDVNDNILESVSQAMGGDTYDNNGVLALTKQMILSINESVNMLPSDDITEYDTLLEATSDPKAKLKGKVTYAYEIALDKMNAEDFSGGAEEFKNHLEYSIQKVIEDADSDLKEETGTDVYCSLVSVTADKAVITIELADAENCRNVLSKEIGKDVSEVSDKELIEFVGEVITDLDSPALELGVSQISTGEEDSTEYFTFLEDKDDALLSSDHSTRGSIKLTVASVTTV